MSYCVIKLGTVLTSVSFQMTTLYSYLGDNPFSVVPAVIAKFPNLKYLYLEGDQLIAIPDAISAMPNLSVRI